MRLKMSASLESLISRNLLSSCPRRWRQRQARCLGRAQAPGTLGCRGPCKKIVMAVKFVSLVRPSGPMPWTEAALFTRETLLCKEVTSVNTGRLALNIGFLEKQKKNTYSLEKEGLLTRGLSLITYSISALLLKGQKTRLREEFGSEQLRYAP